MYHVIFFSRHRSCLHKYPRQHTHKGKVWLKWPSQWQNDDTCFIKRRFFFFGTHIDALLDYVHRPLFSRSWEWIKSSTSTKLDYYNYVCVRKAEGALCRHSNTQHGLAGSWLWGKDMLGLTPYGLWIRMITFPRHMRARDRQITHVLGLCSLLSSFIPIVMTWLTGYYVSLRVSI